MATPPEITGGSSHLCACTTVHFVSAAAAAAHEMEPNGMQQKGIIFVQCQGIIYFYKTITAMQS